MKANLRNMRCNFPNLHLIVQRLRFEYEIHISNQQIRSLKVDFNGEETKKQVNRTTTRLEQMFQLHSYSGGKIIQVFVDKCMHL